MRLVQVLSAVAVVSLGLLSAAAQGFRFSTPAGLAGQPGIANGTNATARFNELSGVAVDAAGTVYVADTANHTIRRVARSGAQWITTTIAGSAGAAGATNGLNAAARFYFPHGIAVNSSGALYVADTYNHIIRKLISAGTNWAVTTLAGNPGVPASGDGSGSSAAFNYPSGIAVDGAGWIYVADAYNHTIRRVSPIGDVETIAGTAGVFGLLNGTNSSAQFYFPSGIAVGPNGDLFVADTYNCLIRKITLVGADWVVTTLAGLPRYPGSNDGVNRAAQFNYPFGLAVAPSGTVYVADTLNDMIRALTISGPDCTVTTLGGLAGTPGAADGPAAGVRFYDPYALAVDRGGNLIIADTYNHTLRWGQPGYSLQVLRIPGQIVLSWPVAASNYVLETTSSLAAGAVWNGQPGAVISATNYVKTNNASTGQAFFRLRLP